MKNILIIFLATVFLVSCEPSSKSKHLTYENIVIISDMSSRLDNRPPKDLQEIHKLIEFFKNECVQPGKKIGDRSSISFSPFSEKVIASIDLEKIKNIGEKQRYINSTGEFKNSGFLQKIDDFEVTVKETYANTKNKGLDLISILLEKIENEQIIKEGNYVIDDRDTTFVDYNNHIYVFTDGYLEYRNKKQNSQYYYGSAEIERVRQFCKDNNVPISKALESNITWCLPRIKNSKNKHIILHILETQERDKNEAQQSYQHPIGLRDNEILEAVWKKWALESGFKKFEWKKY